jgi:hypothetical protein
MWRYYEKLMSWVYTLNQAEWFILLVCVLIVGGLCMRGFGSRKNY